MMTRFLSLHGNDTSYFSEENFPSEVDPPFTAGGSSVYDVSLSALTSADLPNLFIFPSSFSISANSDQIASSQPSDFLSGNSEIVAPPAMLSATLVPVTTDGLGSGQGDVAMNADIARSTYGFDGTGIKIGVLSDSFNAKGGMASDIANGYLPSDTSILKDFAGLGSTDEGRAMAQVAHDVAPGASIAFYTADASESDFAAGILSLCNAGCKVIVDDVTYFDEPFFQDDAIAQAINMAVAQGVTFLTSAGNDANNSYESVFNPIMATLPDGQVLPNLQDFGGGNVLQDVSIGAHSKVFFDLQWDQPYGAAATDMEIRVYANGHLIASADRNATAASWGEAATNPIAGVTIANNGDSAAIVQIAIDDISGPVPDLIKYVAMGNGVPVSILSSPSPSGTLIGHHMDANALTVGAVDYIDTPAFGSTPPQLEPFSSSGGAQLLFDGNGNPLPSPHFLDKVDFVAPDGITTSVAGLTNFFGTSAAAPDAAGVAALMLQANDQLIGCDVGNLLKDSALDMGPVGYDNASGYGLIQADRAVAFAATLTITGTSGNDILFGTHLNDALDGGTGNDILSGGGGRDTFIIHSGYGSDQITDFTSGMGGDIVNLIGYTGIDFSYVQSHLSTVGQGTADQLSLPGGQVLDFSGIIGDPFIADNFLFGGDSSSPPSESGSDKLVLHLSEDAWNGDAQFTLDVDGTQIAAPTDVVVAHSTGRFEDFSYTGNFGIGPHTIAIHFINDGWGGSSETDRNLYVGGITFDGHDYAGEQTQNDAMNGAPDSDSNSAEMLINGTVTFGNVTPTLPPAPPQSSGADTLVVHLSEDAWNGNAQFTVDIDGTQIADPTDVTVLHSSESLEDFTFKGNFGVGPHTVAINFINDAWGGTTDTDRNLYVGGIEFDGLHYDVGSASDNAMNGTTSSDPDVAEMLVNGTVTFTDVGAMAGQSALSAHADQLLV
jgi:hypothetical protein